MMRKGYAMPHDARCKIECQWVADGDGVTAVCSICKTRIELKNLPNGSLCRFENAEPELGVWFGDLREDESETR
jgi:hypothetical protein